MTGALAAIVAFIEARLAEEKERAEALHFACRIPGKVPDFFACGGPAAETYWAHFDPASVLRRVAAVRRILGWAASPALPDYEKLYVLDAVARFWDSHSDYGKGWEP